MKISSPDITHKSDVGGVQLNIANAQAVRSAFKEMMDTVAQQRPEARLTGVTIESMSRRRHGRELLVGVLRDPVFGPAISFGAGGTAAEVLQDRAVGLPPLNQFIVDRMIDGTRIAKLLGGFRNMPPIDRDALIGVLLRVSEMVCQLPELQEMDINPLIADEDGVIAVDARIRVATPPTGRARHAHMAIPPYPGEFTRSWQLPDGTNITIRPIRPEDAKIEREFVNGLSEQSKYFRFMSALQQITPEMLVRFTQIDYDREMALIAVTSVDGREVEIGVARYVTNPDGETCEFAIVIGDAWHGRGIGTRLMGALMDIAREKDLRVIEGEVLANNSKMIALTRDLGFTVRHSEADAGVVTVSKRLG
jgi:acetyltransferase